MTFKDFLSTVSCLIVLFKTGAADIIPTEQCVLVELENNYFGLYLEIPECNNHVSKNFLGVCDLETLTEWQPCPFKKDPRKGCYPSSNKIQRNMCNMQEIVFQKHCNCSSQLNCRQLQPIPDFPTCFLGQRYRRSKSAHVINNCIRCMTKHPDGGVVRLGPLGWKRRVKRAGITPSTILRRFRTIKPRKSLYNRYSRGTESCSFIRKYRSYVPADVKNKLVQKQPNSELKMELNLNFALDRLLRTVSRARKTIVKRHISRRQGSDEDIEDDDEEGDDDIGEDIAIEEEEDEEIEISTTEIAEKDELRQEQHHKKQNYNFTEEINAEIDVKSNKNSSKKGFANERTLLVPCLYFSLALLLILNAEVA